LYSLTLSLTYQIHMCTCPCVFCSFEGNELVSRDTLFIVGLQNSLSVRSRCLCNSGTRLVGGAASLIEQVMLMVNICYSPIYTSFKKRRRGINVASILCQYGWTLMFIIEQSAMHGIGIE
jgi:hypothetical protein